jgi:hypothetical protein
MGSGPPLSFFYFPMPQVLEKLKNGSYRTVAVGTALAASVPSAFADTYAPDAATFSGATNIAKDSFASTGSVITSIATFLVVVVAVTFGRKLLMRGLKKIGI